MIHSRTHDLLHDLAAGTHLVHVPSKSLPAGWLILVGSGTC